MKVSDIDKQIVELIDFMNEKEMKPFASCDGVLEEHEEEYRKIYGERFDVLLKENPELLLCGYISFMENDYTKELLTNALDNDLTINFYSVQKDYELYGNVISGKTFGIRFLNHNGENTEKIHKVVYGTYDKTMIPSKEKLDWVSKVVEVIPNRDLDIFCTVNVNTNKYFTMKKDNFGKESTIFITQTLGKQIIPEEYAEYFKNELNLKVYTMEEDNNVVPERSYIYYRGGIQPACFLILRDEYVERIPEILKKLFEHKFTITTNEQ